MMVGLLADGQNAIAENHRTLLKYARQ